jgi:ATP-binding cassette subfamily B protein
MTVVVVALTIVGALAPIAFTLATGSVIGALTVPAPTTGHVYALIVIAGGIFAIEQVAGPVTQGMSVMLGRRYVLYLRQRVMAACVSPAGIAHLEDPSTLDKIALAQGVGAADIGPREVVVALPVIVGRYLTALSGAIVLARFRWWLGGGLLLSSSLVVRHFRREFVRSAAVLIGKAEGMRRAAYFRDSALTPTAAKESRVFGLGRWLERRFSDEWTIAIRALRRERRGAWRVMAWAPALFFVVDVVAYSLLARAAIHGTISVSQFVVFAGAIRVTGVAASLSQHDLFVLYGAPAVTAVFDLEAAVTELPAMTSGARPSAGLPTELIRFENVSFAYPHHARTVLDGLDLEIPAGRSLAIVGENGAGKTTLVKLLARLYDPTSGRITVDGIDLRDVEPSQWQGRIGALFQDFVHYELPVVDNIGFGASLDGDEDALRSAATRAGAIQLVDGLPRGWATVLSRQFTDGIDLSGGQWQRVALARALYATHQGAGVLVLDEPSANLDVRAEADLYDRFLELTAGLTTILISHRFSTVRRADRIAVLEAGRVVEIGAHDELMSAGGRYARMFGLQAARFAT